MRKYLAVTLLLLFTFSMLASVQTAHATSPIKLDQKELHLLAVEVDPPITYSTRFDGTVTSWKDGDEYVITIDGEMGAVVFGGLVEFYMPYWLDDDKESQITNIEYSQTCGVGTVVELLDADKEHVCFTLFCLFGAGWDLHIECRFQNYGDSSVNVWGQACAGGEGEWKEVELSLSPFTLTIYYNADGTTYPTHGTHTYYYGSSVIVTATADSYYYFDYWLLDGAEYYDNPITVTMDSDHILKVHFEYAGGGGGGGGWTLVPCPTLFVWNGNDYVDYGVINIHNPTGEDMVKEVPVLAEDVGISNHKAKFKLREGWEGLNQSESVIDQVELYAIDNYGNYRLCPLISASHSRLGKVLPQLLLSDNVKAQILLLETIDLTFIMPCQNVQNYTFVIEGCNLYK